MNSSLKSLIDYALLQNTSDSGDLIDFISNNTRITSLYSVGKNYETIKLHHIYSLDGVLDDFSNDLAWSKIPLKKISSIDKNSIVINCATSISPVAVETALIDNGIKNIIGLHEFFLENRMLIESADFIISMKNEINLHMKEWEIIYDSLADLESKKTLLDVICYRLTANTLYMRDYQIRFQEQYFEDFMRYESEYFVDAGGFDGDTSELFANKYSDYKKIYLFEPSAKNIQAAKQRLKSFRDVEFFQKGLSDIDEILQFNFSASASAISSQGTENISTVKLDNFIKKPITFIKMDLEGWELKSLMGAKNHIITQHPKLAIAVYHHSADFRLIFDYIRSLRKDYKIYLRHYTQGWSETIMYFMPT